MKQGQRKLRVEYLNGQEKVVEEFTIEGIGENEQFLHLLRKYPIETIHSLEGTLEQIFIDVTGRSLECDGWQQPSMMHSFNGDMGFMVSMFWYARSMYYCFISFPKLTKKP